MRYYTLGQSGLKVSRLALGTMTFGTEWGWGADEAGAREMFNMSREAGVNFFDTANNYTGGTSEEWLGKFINEAGDRDHCVIASKYSLNTDTDVNTGGNSRKNMMAAVDASLKRMGTDYIDLYYLHLWDRMTPAEEVMRAFDDLVSAGKIRYVGLSDVPAWYASKAQTIANFRGYTPVTALQLQYSLMERNIEDEFTDLCADSGSSLVCWGPIGGGLLSGKYKPSEGRQPDDAGRLAMVQDEDSPAFQKFTPRNWSIIAALEEVANEIGQTMASTALNWALNQPRVSSVLIGASKPSQLRDNLSALDFELPLHLMEKLDTISKTESRFPYSFFEPDIQALIKAGIDIEEKPPHFNG